MSDTVRKIAPVPDAKVIAHLETLLKLAKAGEVKTMAAVAMLHNGDFKTLSGGGFSSEMVAAATVLQFKLCHEWLEK